MMLSFILYILFGMSALVTGILQPSLYTELSRCSLDDLTSQQQRDMSRCFSQCQQNSCCSAVNVTGTCQQFYTLPHVADYISDVSSFPWYCFKGRMMVCFVTEGIFHLYSLFKFCIICITEYDDSTFS